MRTTILRRVAAAAGTAAAAAVPAIALAQPIKPLGDDVTLEEVFGRIINGLFGLMGIVFLATFIYSGFLWMTSAGNADKVKQAKKNMQYAITGIIVSFASYAILDWLLNDVLSSL